jgi:copper chaperone CopZ
MFMKTLLLSSMITFAAAVALHADEVTATINNVHLCCKSCVTGAEKAVSTVEGAKVSADQENGTLTLSGPDTATLQKAADALVQAGYYGKSASPAVALKSNPGAQGKQVQSLEIEGVHLCCAKCAKAVDRAVKSVPGVENQTAVKGAKKFQVTGNFNDRAVFDALEHEGLAGKAVVQPSGIRSAAPAPAPPSKD